MMKKLSGKNWNVFLKTTRVVFGFLLLTIILFACKSIPVASPKREVDFSQYLYKRIEGSDSKYFSCDQIDISIDDGDTKAVKAKINIQRGDFIYANINFLGIELGRAEITPDSIKIINRLEKTYYFDKIEGLNSLLNLDISYNQIESMILKGIVLDKNENRKKFKNHISENTDSYTFGFASSNNLNFTAFFDKESFRESKIEIGNQLADFYLLAIFKNYNDAGTYPEEIEVNLKRHDYNVEISISIGKISYNKLGNRSFSVNSKYREMEF